MSHRFSPLFLPVDRADERRVRVSPPARPSSPRWSRFRRSSTAKHLCRNLQTSTCGARCRIGEGQTPLPVFARCDFEPTYPNSRTPPRADTAAPASFRTGGSVLGRAHTEQSGPKSQNPAGTHLNLSAFFLRSKCFESTEIIREIQYINLKSGFQHCVSSISASTPCIFLNVIDMVLIAFHNFIAPSKHSTER